MLISLFSINFLSTEIFNKDTVSLDNVFSYLMTVCCIFTYSALKIFEISWYTWTRFLLTAVLFALIVLFVILNIYVLVVIRNIFAVLKHFSKWTELNYYICLSAIKSVVAVGMKVWLPVVEALITAKEAPFPRSVSYLLLTLCCRAPGKWMAGS
jgi:hypothetical protein